nr:DoxX family protein [Flavobacterium lindanitolerans]
MLTVFKVLGALVLIIPAAPKRLKEWAYAGFTFDFLGASASHAAVDGFGFEAVFPLIVLGVLLLSYVSYHKLNSQD